MEGGFPLFETYTYYSITALVKVCLYVKLLVPFCRRGG